MTDYVNCPTCHGRGLIPVQDAEPITAHVDAERQAQLELQRDREKDMVATRLADRLADSAARDQRMQELLSRGGSRPTIVVEPRPEENGQ